MSDHENKVKVVDRRRFIQDGESIRENPDARPDEPSHVAAPQASRPTKAEPQPATKPVTPGAPQKPVGAPEGTQTAKPAGQAGNGQPAAAGEDKKQAAERKADQAAAGLPPADVITLIEFVAQQVSLYLGEPDPMGRSIQPNLPAAGLFIDLLGVLKEKTQGNLSLEEQHALDQVLTALRLRYVQMRG